jgi:alpha-galactosidase
MNSPFFKTYKFNDTLIEYSRNGKQSGIQLRLFPAGKKNILVEKRKFITGRPEVDNFSMTAGPLPTDTGRDSLVQLKLMEEPTPGGFSAGLTLFDSPTTAALEFVAQEEIKIGSQTDIQTVLRHHLGITCTHHLVYRDGAAGVETYTEINNESNQTVSVELLSSFVLNGITPFNEGEATGHLRLHRFRSWWSAEARLETQTLEELHLERPWITCGIRTEKFGQAGSMPVRKYFPFIAAEDTEAGVTWAAKLAWAGSWQMEAIRSGDTLTLTGGLADRESGHWIKKLAPGEILASPKALIACSDQGLDDVCQRLTRMQEADMPQLEEENNLPLIFNEWCTSWGNPTAENIIETADRLTTLPVRYLVIDAGWAVRPGGTFAQSNGDWNVDPEKFPNGLKPVTDAIRERGMIPGIWFEFEICTPESSAWNKTDHQLHKDGRVLQVGTRRFWNLRDPWVQDYLHEKVIRLLKENNFGYLKVDYNDTIGTGCDHPDSIGEGLRLQILAIHDFFRRLQNEVPGLVIENCSSGGHRLEPSMIALTSMSSFSDAHEGQEIPIIAANLQRLVPPRQNQIWAVLRKSDSDRRLIYSLTAGCLGRLCISGDIANLSAQQIDLVKEGLEFYQAAAPIIKDGISEFYNLDQESYREPTGWQAVLRYSPDRTKALAVFHSFGGKPSSHPIRLPLENGTWKLVHRFQKDAAFTIEDSQLTADNIHPFSGMACLIKNIL